jgi:hypothetical protein
MNRTLPASMPEEFSVFVQPVVGIAQATLCEYFLLERTRNS